MKVIFVGVFYFEGQVKHLYRIFTIYKALANAFKSVGIEVKFFAKQNEILPLQDTLTEEMFYKELPQTDLVFMWNGDLPPELKIAEQCKELGIPVYFSELGWLPQNGTFYFDFKGVNYKSSIADWEYKQELCRKKQIEVNNNISYYHKVLAKKTTVSVPKDFVFVPFQVESDSQIIKHSSRIKKMQQLVDYVSSFIKGKIVFKTHPKHSIQGIEVPENCELVNDGATHDFLPKCKYVVTINSTVGVEALTYHKPIITLGEAFYGGRQLTYNVTDDKTMRNAVAWAEKGRAAVGVIDAFLHYLFKRQWYSSDLNNSERIFELIENVTTLKAEE